MNFDLSVYQLSILLIIVLTILAITVLPKEYTALLFLSYLAVYILVNMFFNHFNNRRIEQYEILNEQLKLKMDIRPKTKFPFSFFFLNKRANFDNQKFGFQWVFPTLSGMYLGQSMEFSVDTVIEPDSKREIHYSNIIVNASHTGNNFSIRSRTFRDKFRIWGRKRFLTGDPTFDEYFQVETNNPSYIHTLFDTPIRQLIVNHTYKKATLSLEKGQLNFRERKIMTNVKERKHFEQVILLLYMLAKRIDQIIELQQLEQASLPAPEANIESAEEKEIPKKRRWWSRKPKQEKESIEERYQEEEPAVPPELADDFGEEIYEDNDIYEMDDPNNWEDEGEYSPELEAQLKELIEKGAIESFPEDSTAPSTKGGLRSLLRLPKFLKRK